MAYLFAFQSLENLYAQRYAFIYTSVCLHMLVRTKLMQFTVGLSEEIKCLTSRRQRKNPTESFGYMTQSSLCAVQHMPTFKGYRSQLGIDR